MDDIVAEHSGDILRIQLNRPTRRNAMTSAMYVALAGIFNDAAKDEHTFVALWHGAGDSFCAGNDIEDFLKNPPGPGDSPQALLMNALVNFDKPVVAAVHGAAIGGGLGLAVAADFRVTCPEARFAANFTKLGFHPGFGLTVTLPELVGKNNAELIFYTSRRVTGEEATRMGLANKCVPQDQVRSAAMKLAQEIAECSPLGLLSTRATMRAGLADRVLAATNHELAEQTRLRATEDFAEGVKATTERRAANFKGR
jgi:enoyl-CoA hydratase/carnithine racemase